LQVMVKKKQTTDAAISPVLQLLQAAYRVRTPEPNHDPLGVLIQTILSQNTSDTNSGRAFEALKKSFRVWDELLITDEAVIADIIRSGGLARIKARRIMQALNIIREKRGDLDLDFLDSLSVAEAREWLKQLPGVGDKTASCVLLFAFGRPALPVDTHIYRVAGRLGWLNQVISPAEAHRVLGEKVPLDDVFRFHILMIEHGRKTCYARNPRCSGCVLGKLCPSGRDVRKD
jgi:endonuclease III